MEEMLHHHTLKQDPQEEEGPDLQIDVGFVFKVGEGPAIELGFCAAEKCTCQPDDGCPAAELLHPSSPDCIPVVDQPPAPSAPAESP
jgi:hypothetical protein